MLTHEKLRHFKRRHDWRKMNATNAFKKDGKQSSADAVSDKKSDSAVAAANILKDEFLSKVSHELRTPLSAIVGWTQLLLSENVDENTLRKGLETIHRNALAQSQLINDLLDVSRIASGRLKIEPQDINLSETVQSAVESAAPLAAAKQIALNTSIEENIARVHADPHRVSQIVSNLLANALKFTPKNGSVEVKIRRVNSFVEISVSDTGIGIKPEVLPHIFDRQRMENQTAQRSGGLGLGLAIVRHLAEAQGGAVEVLSDGEGKGATFTVRLPVVNEQAESTKKTGEKKKAFADIERLNGAKLLLVDDDSDSLEVLTMLFDSLGAKVETAGSAAEAIEKYHPFSPDLVISDIGMPDEDGYSLMKRLRQIMAGDGGQKPAIALTAFTKNEDVKRAFAAGFQSHIKKPVETRELLENVTELLKSWGKKS